MTDRQPGAPLARNRPRAAALVIFGLVAGGLIALAGLVIVATLWTQLVWNEVGT